MLKYFRSKDVLTADVEGSTLMMNAESGQYAALSAIASEIWQLLDEPRSLEWIVEQLQTEYDVAPTLCQTEVSEFLQEMLHLGLVGQSS